MRNINLKCICFLLFFVVISIGTAQVVSQKIGVNPTLISTSALLEVESLNKGILIPRIALTSTLDVTTINSPAISLLIYNTVIAGSAPNDVTPGFYFWNGISWVRLATGNAALSAEVDGVIGNEVTDALANGGLTRTGIGIASDPYKLEINDGTTNGQILTWDGANLVPQAASSDWSLSGNSGTNPSTNFIGTTDVQDFAFRSNNSEVMRISPVIGGRVGIGVISPSEKLDVSGGVKAQRVVVQNALGYGWGVESTKIDGSTGTSKRTAFFTDSTERMRIISGGNVGIGTTTPASKLEVNSSFAFPLTRINTNLTLTANHAVVSVNTTVGDVTIILPAASTATYRIYSIV